LQEGQYESSVPTIADRVVQASLKLVLEPIFEADFKPCSYGFRPNRRAHDAIAEIHHLASEPINYRWVFEADIKACFDEISHSALMDRLRARIKDKRICALVKAFLKSGVMTELGDREETLTGTPQGGLCNAFHKPPYEQCRVMRSAGLLALVAATLRGDRCA
jgi:RNA-directed DNA polymerase